MLRTHFYQMPMGAVDPDKLRLPSDSFERQLRDELPNIVSVDDFADSAVGGRPRPIQSTGFLC